MKKWSLVATGLAILLTLFVSGAARAQMMPGMMSAPGSGMPPAGMGAMPGMMGMGGTDPMGGMSGGMMGMMPMMMNMMGGMGMGSMPMGGLQTPETQALTVEARGEWLVRQGEITKKMGEELMRQAKKLKEAGSAPAGRN